MRTPHVIVRGTGHAMRPLGLYADLRIARQSLQRPPLRGGISDAAKGRRMVRETIDLGNGRISSAAGKTV